MITRAVITCAVLHGSPRRGPSQGPKASRPCLCVGAGGQFKGLVNLTLSDFQVFQEMDSRWQQIVTNL